MPKGMHLRTNYRETGGVMDITALGGGIPLSSAAGGAGTDTPYCGLTVFSMAMTTGDRTAGLAIGQTFAFYDSTYGTMSLYYGCTKFNSGYLFWPANYLPLSISDQNFTDWTGGKSAAALVLAAQANSGSIWRMSFCKVSAAGCVTYACATGLRLLIMGFIISAP